MMLTSHSSVSMGHGKYGDHHHTYSHPQIYLIRVIIINNLKSMSILKRIPPGVSLRQETNQTGDPYFNKEMTLHRHFVTPQVAVHLQ